MKPRGQVKAGLMSGLFEFSRHRLKCAAGSSLFEERFLPGCAACVRIAAVMCLLTAFTAVEALGASPAEWVFLGEGQSGDSWHLDKKSVGRVSKQSVRAWIKAEFTQPNILQTKQPLRQSSLVEWQCPEMKHRTLETVTQFTDGTKSTAKGSSAGGLAPPSIVLDSLYLFLCSGDAGCEWKSPGCPE